MYSGAMPLAVWRSPEWSSGGSRLWIEEGEALAGRLAGDGRRLLLPQQDKPPNKLPSDLAAPCFPPPDRCRGGGDVTRRRHGCGFLRSDLPLFFLWCLCISGFFFVAGIWRCSGVGAAVVLPADRELSPWGLPSGDAARRSCRCRTPGAVAVDFGARWASNLLQYAVCRHGAIAIAVGFNRNSTGIYLLDLSSDEHHRIAISVTWILEQEAAGDVYFFSWCLPCIMDSRQDDKHAEDNVSHPSELIHRRQMREPLSMILRFDGRDDCNLGSVSLPTDLQPNCPEPQVHMPARLLGAASSSAGTHMGGP